MKTLKKFLQHLGAVIDQVFIFLMVIKSNKALCIYLYSALY